MHDHAGRSAAVITPLFADERESLSGSAASVDLRGLDRVPAGADPGRQARSGAASCSERAGGLVAELRAELAAAAQAHAAGADALPAPWGKVPEGAAVTPAGEVIPARTAAWLRARTSAPVLTPGYETELARRTGPDLFGLLCLPDPPPFLAAVRPETLRPHHVAPLLRRISMTGPAPDPADLRRAALAADPGSVSTYRRTPRQRRWEQPPGTPALPAVTTIPHIIHGIWLGGPVTTDAPIHASFAAAATAHPDHDFALWTDVSRDTFTQADAAPLPPAGTPDPHAPYRNMLTWARASRIHLINVHEIFHNQRPMTLHRQYAAEHNKQLPRGYAGASDHLRLDIIHLLGGTYLDGDNTITTTSDIDGNDSLTTFIDAVAASPHGFTLHMLPGGINNDLITAPARHPAITLWRELARGSYLFTQREIFGGLDKMARQYVGRSADQMFLRYTVPMRAARLLGLLFGGLAIGLYDERMVRAAPAITHGSELSWSKPAPPTPPAPLTPTQITTALTRATTTLARQLTTREGNLHLTAIDPLITTLPDPDAAWTAIITTLAELTTPGHPAHTTLITPATSITQFRWNDDGTPHHITLPPEAEAHITRTPHPHTTWLLDEAVTPAGLTTRTKSTVADAVIEAAGGSTEVGRRVRQGRRERAARAAVLAAGLRAELAAAARAHAAGAPTPPGPWGKVPEGATLTPAGEVIPARTAAWLRRAVGAPVLTPGYETELARRTGPDLFGLLRLPGPPPFLAEVRPETLRPDYIAPLLRRISMTRPAPDPADLRPAALAADPGPVSTYHRSGRQRRWEQPPGTPALPAVTTIPHIGHGIWLGAPVTAETPIHSSFAQAAINHPDHDFVVWTDIDRTTFTAADATTPAADGTPDPHAPYRDMLTWARQHGIHLVSVHEIFHAARPMTLHRQYTAEHAKQLPRGYAGASDHLRLDIIHLLGGTYLDGDNTITTTSDIDTDTTDPRAFAKAATLTELFDAVAASPHGFALHLLPGKIVNNDLIVAPARHPAITLWRELNRASYLLTQSQLFGGVDEMAKRHTERPSTERWKRYTVPTRAGRVHCRLVEVLAIAIDDERMVRAAPAITHGSELSWSKPAPPTPPAPLTPTQITTALTRATTTLARQLTTREGNLHLTAIDPLITTLPDPDAAWTAIITTLAELTTTGTITPATSITQFRWNDDGTPHHITLPPEAEAHITRTPHPHTTWLGHTTAAPGHPAWLLDETITPAHLVTNPNPTNLPPLRVLAQQLTDPHGTTTGLRIPAPPHSPPAPAPPAPPGYATLHLDTRHGHAWTGNHPITPDDLALLLLEHNLHTKPLLITTTPNPHTPTHLATQLTHLTHQPTLTTDHTTDTALAGPGQVRDLAEQARRLIASSAIAEATSDASNLTGLQEIGREAVQRAKDAATGSGRLLLALDTRRLAAMLADAELMTGHASERRDAARQAASDQVFEAYRLLSDERSSHGWPAAVEAATASGAVAGILAAATALRSQEHASATRRWRANLAADPGIDHEAKAVRRRLARARESGTGAAIADQVQIELQSSKWPGLSGRLELIRQAERQAYASIGIRAIAEAVRDRRAAHGQPEPLPAFDQIVQSSSDDYPDHHAGRSLAAIERRVGRGRRERAERAKALIAELRAELTAATRAHEAGADTPPAPWGKAPEGAALTPAGEVVGARTAAWLRAKTSAPVLSPDYEAELARRTGPDPFGLLRLPGPPPFLAVVRPETLRPDHVAPLLRRISMTGPAPDPADLHPRALAANPGPVSAYHRSGRQRRWEQPPGTPALPATTVIPHVVHGIWLGGPIPRDAAIRTAFAAAATRYPGHDFALWTDIDRATFTAADATLPPADGTPDPYAPHRDMLAWARDHNIHLINVHEVFHSGRPMTLHRQYTAEHAKQLPRGYAAASDHLRLDIIHLLGGTYIDGDNTITTAPATAGTDPLTQYIDTVTQSPHGFTLHMLPGGINNDLITAPARHPAITLWRELGRHRYNRNQRELFGSLDRMTRRYVGGQATLLRYSVVHRTGRVHHEMLQALGIAIDDERMVRAAPAITHGSELSWSKPAPPTPPAPLTPTQITTALTRATTTLARQLTTREGNLHLTAIDPLITTLPDPDAAWTAIITTLAELTTTGTITPATSITQFRWNDDGTPHHITLPPEAEAHITRTPHPHTTWLGHTTAAPGHPAWLLDETITPAHLVTNPNPTNLPPLRVLAQQLTDPHGTTTGLRIPAPPHSPPAPAPPAPPGYATLHLDTRHGHAWTGNHPITPDDLALLLLEHNLHTKPLLITTTPNPHTPTHLATQLTHLTHQPTLTTDQIVWPPA